VGESGEEWGKWEFHVSGNISVPRGTLGEDSVEDGGKILFFLIWYIGFGCLEFSSYVCMLPCVSFFVFLLYAGMI
jgi:hypothetical protein